MMERWWSPPGWLVLVGGLLLLGCGEPLVHGLEERAANEMVVALSLEGFYAQKVRDPQDGELWAVRVPREDRVEAWMLLQREGLPRPATYRFEEVYPTGGLIPTSQEERVMLQVATARDLQGSLLKVQGVVDAHVHLVLPEVPRVRLSHEEAPRPRASVLLTWNVERAEPPISVEEVRRLVSGSVDGLVAEDVEVVLSSFQSPYSESRGTLTMSGPGIAGREDMKVIVTLAGLFAMLVASAMVYTVFFFRRRREGA